MEDLRKIQRVNIEMLKMLKEVCEDNSIPYFLAQGTLLGAVRHKGFIPWDDDVDTLVPYDKIPLLMKCFNEKYGKDYIITNHTVEKYYPSTWTKIRKKNTSSMAVKYKDLPINWGICIDVFPFYPVSNNVFLRKTEIFLFKSARKLLLASMTKYDTEKGITTKLAQAVPIGIRHKIVDCVLKIFDLHKKDTEYVFLTCKGGKVIKRDVLYSEKKSLIFEGIEFSVPAKYHEFLVGMFGDYMTLPPEEQRRGHEDRMGEIIWDCEKSYKEYR